MPLRPKDWADNEADRLVDLLRDGSDDEELTNAIAQSLRKAAKDLHGARVTGQVGNHPEV